MLYALTLQSNVNWLKRNTVIQRHNDDVSQYMAKMASIIESNSIANNESDKTKLNLQQFSKIVISLENCVLPNQLLSPTPSMKDGLDYEHEIDLRILGCELIQISGILLKLPQVAMATGQVLFQRYYYCKSLVRFQMEVSAMACVTLATKIEEAPRRIRDVINVFHHIKQIRLNEEIKPLILDDNYVNLKNQVIKAERRLLKELGFCVHVKHPHKIIVTLLQVLENEKNQYLMQTSWNYMNDSLRTNVFVRYSPETIACSCIYLSARVLKIPLPNNPHWFEIFRVTEVEIQDVCKSILNLYSRQKPNQEQLEKIIDCLRKDHENAKLKAKTSGVENGTVSHSEQSPESSRATSPIIKTKSSANSPSKSSQKSMQSLVCHANSPNKKRLIESSPLLSKRSKSRSDSPIDDRNTNHYEKNERIDRDRERTPPKLYSSYNKDLYSRSRSRSRDKDRHHHHHKHKRITYSRSRSRSPASTSAPLHSHYNYHSHYNSKYYLVNNTNKKSRKRSKSPNERNSYHSRSRRSRSRELYLRRS